MLGNVARVATESTAFLCGSDSVFFNSWLMAFTLNDPYSLKTKEITATLGTGLVAYHDLLLSHSIKFAL